MTRSSSPGWRGRRRSRRRTASRPSAPRRRPTPAPPRCPTPAARSSCSGSRPQVRVVAGTDLDGERILNRSILLYTSSAQLNKAWVLVLSMPHVVEACTLSPGQTCWSCCTSEVPPLLAHLLRLGFPSTSSTSSAWLSACRRGLEVLHQHSPGGGDEEPPGDRARRAVSKEEGVPATVHHAWCDGLPKRSHSPVVA